MTETKSRLQKYSAPALEKGLDIIELLSLYSGGGLSQSEIADGVGRSKNEIFRMMVVLEEREYIRRVDGDLFRLSDKMGNMTGSRNTISRMLEIARPYMSDLSRETDLSNHMWIVKDGVMQVAASTRLSNSYSLGLEEGAQAPLFGTSAGACFLSGKETVDEREEVLLSVGEHIARDKIDRFDIDIEACRRDGYCALLNRESNGIMEVSAPLDFQGNTGVVGALSIPMISKGDAQNEMFVVAEALKSTISQIRNRLLFLGVFSASV